MIITCNQCESSFSIDDRLIKGTGSKVKCSKCSHLFVAYPPSLVEEAGVAPDEPPAAAAGLAQSDGSELKFDIEDDQARAAAPDMGHGQPSDADELDIELADFNLDEDGSSSHEFSFEESSGDEDRSVAARARWCL